jgi:hypothetical protein
MQNKSHDTHVQQARRLFCELTGTDLTEAEARQVRVSLVQYCQILLEISETLTATENQKKESDFYVQEWGPRSIRTGDDPHSPGRSKKRLTGPHDTRAHPRPGPVPGALPHIGQPAAGTSPVAFPQTGQPLRRTKPRITVER